MKRVQHFGLRIPFYWMLAIALTFTACKKGDTGPQGDKGDKGEKGDKGDKGNTGDKGSANVLYSSWKDLAFSLDTTFDVYFVNLPETKVTDSILSFGEIKVFVNLGTPTNKVISPLPYVEDFIQIRPFFRTGVIQIESNVNASSYTDTNGGKRLQYRYVIIPGGAALRTGIDWNDYEQVKKALGLPD